MHYVKWTSSSLQAQTLVCECVCVGQTSLRPGLKCQWGGEGGVAERTSAHKAAQKTTAGPRGRTSCQLHRRPPNNNIIIKLSLAFKGGSVRGCPGFPVAALRELLDASDGVNTAVKRLNGGFEAAATTPRNNNYIRFMSCEKRQRQRRLVSTSATAAFKKSSLITSQNIAVLMM